MILVDTSVWVSHLRNGEIGLTALLNEGHVVCHSFIIGELACGNLKNRSEILSLFQALPMAVQAEHEEVMEFIERHRLMGKGLGYIDVHLLASAVLTDVSLWTFDRRLIEAASKLNKHYTPSHS
ncbi:MAG: PIN domain-containing protein [Deltaproteobacteria bacterium]|jgi:predicted nucleic acid-binding protein|nr:PIN domain-containing protein [Deltaproteobacteria bacterium]